MSCYEHSGVEEEDSSIMTASAPAAESANFISPTVHIRTVRKYIIYTCSNRISKERELLYAAKYIHIRRLAQIEKFPKSYALEKNIYLIAFT